MSSIIHIDHKPPAWRIALQAVCIVALLACLVWYALRDDMPAPTRSAPPPPVAAVYRNLPPVTAAAPAEARELAAARAEPLQPPIAADTSADAGNEFATRNAHIDIRQLTTSRPVAAKTFLTEVLLSPGSQGGFVVADVLPDSRYERLGLRPGDLIYSLDTPKTAAVDENSIVALMQQTELEIEVYRNGTLTRLQHSLGSSPEETAHVANR